MKPAVLLLLLALVFPPGAWSDHSPAAAASPDSRNTLQGKVLWVYDGDTLQVAGIGKVRLLGIDVPERESSPRDDYFLHRGIAPATLRRIHRESREFLTAQIRGKTVSLDREGERRDRYGRLLGYVTLPDGRLLNRVMLEKGYAVVYRRFDFALKADFLRAEARARRNRTGLWE